MTQRQNRATFQLIKGPLTYRLLLLWVKNSDFFRQNLKKGGAKIRLPFPMLLCHAGSPGFLEGVVETFLFDAKSRAEFSKAAAIF